MKHKDDTSLLGMVRGLGDVFETCSTATGSDSIEQAVDNLPDEQRERLQGNLVWRALKRRIYQCDDRGENACLAPRVTEDTISGMIQRVKDVLLGQRHVVGSAGLAQSSSAFQRGLSSTAAASASRTGETFDSRAMAWNYEASGSQTDRALLSEGESLARKYAQSGVTSEQMAGLITSGLKVSGGGGSGTEVRGNISGQLQSRYGVDERLSDEIADDISRRVTSDQEFSARLAEGVKADIGSGTRNVFTEGMRSEYLSTLSRQAGDTVSASRSHQRATQVRFFWEGWLVGPHGTPSTGAHAARQVDGGEARPGRSCRSGRVGDVSSLAQAAAVPSASPSAAHAQALPHIFTVALPRIARTKDPAAATLSVR